MKKILAALSVAVVLAVAVTGCEPAMKITAKNGDTSDAVACGQMTHIKGTVTPATATKKVVLQATKAGKWVDVKGWGSYDTSYTTNPTLRTGNVSQTTGNYSIPYFVDWYQSTKHLRVRSAGGTTSPGFYLRSEGTDGAC